tara:strand:+ start:395 stop:715 length:321 start_codon:yes stop_codon:yes gene_type:complete
MNNKRLFSAEHSGHSINRIKLLRILLDGKVQCYACERKYASDREDSPKRMDRLQVSDWIVTMLPEKLTIELKCGYCEHKGLFNMEPNPFMDTNNIDKYAALVAGKE